MEHQWAPLLLSLASELDAAGIPYSFDAATALLMQGLQVPEMDDIDLSVQWNSLEKVRQLFVSHTPTLVEHKPGWAQFRFLLQGVPVHVLSYEGTVLAHDPHRATVAHGGRLLWCKSLDFFLQHLPVDHPRRRLIEAHLGAKERLEVKRIPGYLPEIAPWIWALEDVRQTVKQLLKGISQEQLDYQPPGRHSVGSLLYHIALIESDWLFVEVMETDIDEDLKALLPYDNLTDGEMTAVAGQTLAQHLARLDAVRAKLLACFAQMDLADWRRARELPNYTVTPEWVLYHLVEHEAHHRGQMAETLRLLRNEGE